MSRRRIFSRRNQPQHFDLAAGQRAGYRTCRVRAERCHPGRVRSGTESIEGVLRGVEFQLRTLFVSEQSIRAAYQLTIPCDLVWRPQFLPGCQCRSQQLEGGPGFASRQCHGPTCVGSGCVQNT